MSAGTTRHLAMATSRHARHAAPRHPVGRAAGPAARTAWGGLLALLLGLVTATVLAVVLTGGDGRSAGGRPAVTSAPDRPTGVDPRADPGDDAALPTAAESDPRSVLRAWDRRRSRAWATADVPALRELYAPRSQAGERDQAMLRRWQARGLRVTGLDTQVLDLRVLERGPRRLVLRVEDRVSAAVARGDGGAVLLPADVAQWRTVTLLRSGRSWQVSSVEQA